MERLFFKIMIFTLFLVGCSNRSDTQDEVLVWDPLDVYMVNHITRIHRIVIDRETWADVMIKYTNETITVKFSDAVINSSDGDILTVLDFGSNSQDFIRNDYMTFLSKLHAYLTLNPVKKR